MAIHTALTDTLDIRHPVLLAPMDLVADGKLAAAVSSAGGFGILGGGYGDETWLKKELDVAGKARVGVGFITWSMARQPRLLDVTLERKPAAVMLSFGDPAPHADRIKRAGALLICQVQTAAMAKDAVAKGADIIVAQGTEGGGHGGSVSTMPLVPAIVDAVGNSVPVVAAGGIADGRGLAAALMLGASGVLWEPVSMPRAKPPDMWTPRSGSWRRTKPNRCAASCSISHAAMSGLGRSPDGVLPTRIPIAGEAAKAN